jgi:hypothetical protein
VKTRDAGGGGLRSCLACLSICGEPPSLEDAGKTCIRRMQMTVEAAICSTITYNGPPMQ